QKEVALFSMKLSPMVKSLRWKFKSTLNGVSQRW
ncbi:hypothetical protein VCHENC02_4659, partial [Vibrio harveyi]